MSDSNRYNEVDETDNYDEEVDRNPAERGKWVSALIALAGIWLAGATLFFDALAANFWNSIIIGGALIALGGYNYYRRASDELGSTAAAVISALLGLWLVAAPFIFGAGFDVTGGFGELTTEFWFWNDVIVGLVVLALGAYSAYEASDTDSDVVRPTGQ